MAIRDDNVHTQKCKQLYKNLTNLLLFFSIEGELVLKAGDKVKYRTVPLPPKCVEKQAVEVIITAANGPHERWSPLSHSSMSAH